MEISANPKKAKTIWEEKIGNRIKFIDQQWHYVLQF